MTPVFIFPLVLKVVGLQSKVTGLRSKAVTPGQAGICWGL